MPENDLKIDSWKFKKEEKSENLTVAANEALAYPPTVYEYNPFVRRDFVFPEGGKSYYYNRASFHSNNQSFEGINPITEVLTDASGVTYTTLLPDGSTLRMITRDDEEGKREDMFALAPAGPDEIYRFIPPEKFKALFATSEAKKYKDFKNAAQVAVDHALKKSTHYAEEAPEIVGKRDPSVAVAAPEKNHGSLVVYRGETEESCTISSDDKFRKTWQLHCPQGEDVTLTSERAKELINNHPLLRTRVTDTHEQHATQGLVVETTLAGNLTPNAPFTTQGKLPKTEGKPRQL